MINRKRVTGILPHRQGVVSDVLRRTTPYTARETGESDVTGEKRRLCETGLSRDMYDKGKNPTTKGRVELNEE